ncbi:MULTISPECIES: helicase HerA-like domain-containing protein [unclassified Roseateles]|uniref:helicase HerA-like domain-containing protein n=1 Tax=unclassified Roseateles TaxID=2626991 RepID=UPI0006FC5170|nr:MULTISPECIES: helicase HerA-like domain-containing protein [unclassified Roseateles]KQW51952.1 ATP-binding protein [Pelomonas sp. Root405]KRA78185.1 ATP-binding protein [Pelomonas sp. Root662]
MTDPILLARHGDIECLLLPALANRHGLITGATGTGKTISLQKLAESFSKLGVPVFMADVKGDLTGISQPGNPSEKLLAVLKDRGIDPPEKLACPTTLWDVFGEQGHPVRATVSDMGPLLLARMLALNETQAGVLQMVFKIADDNGLLLLDLKDLRAMLQHVGDNASQFTTQYGNVSAASVGAIQRGLLQIEAQGGDKFFGEPMLNIADFMQTDGGLGVINVLAADKLMNAPRLYATFLLWMLSELFETLPEVGDLEKPKLVFFFDEAHLLFKDAPDALVERIELVVRLVRSKGVGVYFVTQNPLDIPDAVLGQLGNRVQHALRAFTPRDQKAVKSAADTMRAKPGLDIATAITELAVGEALVSLLDEKGRPSITERVFVLPPGSQIGPITPAQRQALLANSLVAGVYEKLLDRESAYERLAAQHAAPAGGGMAAEGGAVFKGGPAAPAPAQDGGGMLGGLKDVLFGTTGPRGGRHPGLAEKAAQSAVRSIGSAVGREIIRGVLGSILGGGSRRR